MSNFNTTSKDQNNQNQNNNIYPKSCNYGCNTQIYWNNSLNEYWEVFTQKKHICPNRVNNKPTTTTTNNKPTYYSKKPWSTQPKPKMSNSFELLQGPIETVQNKYEILSDIVIALSGRVFGSQSHISPHNNTLSIVVYFEVAEGRLNEFKQRFQNNKNEQQYKY